MDCGKPTGPGHGGTLRVGDGDEAHVIEFPEERVEIGDVEAAVERGRGGDFEAADLRKREVIEMEMDEIVFVRLLSNGFDEIEVVCEWRKQFAAFEPERSFT